MRKLILISLLSLATCAAAQRMGSAGHFAPMPRAPHSGAFSSRSGFAAFSAFNRFGYSRGLYYPLLFDDPLYSDYLSSTGYPVVSQPPVIILQNLPAASPTPEGSSAPTQPLMIELQGNRYVRVSSEETSEAQVIDGGAGSSSSPETPPVIASHAAMAHELPPAVLVFRDGHREEISDYTIADGVLYTTGNYYADGSWTRKIELSTLDLPATVDSNQSRGLRFQLPSMPNEVVIRP